MRVIFVCAERWAVVDRYIAQQNNRSGKIEYRGVVEPRKLMAHSHREVVMVGPWFDTQKLAEFERINEQMFNQVTEADAPAHV